MIPTSGFHSKRLYHATLEPVTVTTPQQERDLIRNGYATTYIHREWPKMVYHADNAPKVVANPDELEEAEAEGYSLEHELVQLTDNPNGPKEPHAKGSEQEIQHTESVTRISPDVQAILDENARLHELLAAATAPEKK